MQPSPLVLRTRDFVRTGLDDRQLRRLHSRGLLARVVAGTYVDAERWAALSARHRHAVRVHAAVSRLGGPVAASHWSAAAVWGFPVPSAWPEHVEVVDPRRSECNRIPSLLRRPGDLRPGDTCEWEGVRVTSAARTAADLCLASPFEHAVLVLDHGLHEELFTKDEVGLQLGRRPGARRRRSAARALEFADGRAEYAGESFSRVGMAEHGLLAPTLQRPFGPSRRPFAVVDFWWESVGVVGEFDGEWKYSDERFLRGRTPAEAFRDEKRRQARLELEPEVRRVVRWDYPVARSPEELARRLLAAGVPRQ